MRLAHAAGTAPLPHALDALLAAAAACTSLAERWREARPPSSSRDACTKREPGPRPMSGAQPERLLVSPHGVAIAFVRLAAGQNAILKVPYTLAAEARVARNAAALAWLAEHAAELGPWERSSPRLLARGRAGSWSYALEERVSGIAAQAWDEAAAERAMCDLVEFLERLGRCGGSPRRLAPPELESLCAAPFRSIEALVEPRVARHLHAFAGQLLQTLQGLRVPLVPRHGDFKLENVLGEPSRLARLRVLDWELWCERGLPLLDLWHLIVSRRQRRAGCSLGEAVRRWLLPGDLTRDEAGLVERLSRGLDPGYVEISPVLYWLDRVGPVAERGAWPSEAWQHQNVVQVLEALESFLEVRR